MKPLGMTKRIHVDLPSPMALHGSRSLGSPVTPAATSPAGEPGGVRRMSAYMESQASLSVATSPVNSSISGHSITTAASSHVSAAGAYRSHLRRLSGATPSVASSIAAKGSRHGEPAPPSPEAAMHQTASGPILGTTLHRVDDQSSTFSMSFTTKRSSTSMHRASQLIDEDVNAPTFFFRNMSILRLNETMDLSVKISDGEHVLRSQCVYFATVFYELIRDRIYEPNKQYVAIVGCGRIGRLIVGSLLDLGWPAESILVCTRDLQNVADLRTAGVVCTTRHSSLSGIPLVMLAVSPINLREIMEQMSGVLRPETLLISLMAGVTSEKLLQVFKHDLILRTVADNRCFPAPWSSYLVRQANDFLGFEVRTYSEYLNQAVRHMIASPGYVNDLVDKFRLFAQRLEWDESSAEMVLQEVLLGRSLAKIREEEEEDEEEDEEGDGDGSEAGDETDFRRATDVGLLVAAVQAGEEKEAEGGLVNVTDVNDLQSRYTSGGSSGTTHSNRRTPSTGMTTRMGSSGIARRHQRGMLSSTSSSFSSTTTSVRSTLKPGHQGHKSRGSSKKSTCSSKPFSENRKFEKLEHSVSSLVLPVFQRALCDWVSEQQRLANNAGATAASKQLLRCFGSPRPEVSPPRSPSSSSVAEEDILPAVGSTSGSVATAPPSPPPPPVMAMMGEGDGPATPAGEKEVGDGAITAAGTTSVVEPPSAATVTVVEQPQTDDGAPALDSNRK